MSKITFTERGKTLFDQYVKQQHVKRELPALRFSSKPPLCRLQSGEHSSATLRLGQIQMRNLTLRVSSLQANLQRNLSKFKKSELEYSELMRAVRMRASQPRCKSRPKLTNLPEIMDPQVRQLKRQLRFVQSHKFQSMSRLQTEALQ